MGGARQCTTDGADRPDGGDPPGGASGTAKDAGQQAQHSAGGSGSGKARYADQWAQGSAGGSGSDKDAGQEAQGRRPIEAGLGALSGDNAAA